MATPDEARIPPDDAPPLSNHNSDQLQATDTATMPEMTNGDTSMLEDAPASPVSRPAPSPIHSPMNHSTADIHMNGTDEDVSDHPTEQSTTIPIQAQQIDSSIPSNPPEVASTPPAPQSQSQSQPLATPLPPKDAPSPSPRSTPAPSTSAATRTPAPAAAAQDAIPSQMANNEHGSAARVYINSRITPTLLEGMKWVAKHEPEKPLKWLSEFLARRSAELEGV